MPKDAARKRPIRDFQHATGRRYNDARRELEEPEPGLPFDPGWLNLAVTACPVCGGDTVEWMLRGNPHAPASPAFGPPPEPGEITDFIRPTDPGICTGCYAMGDGRAPDLWRLSNGLEADRCPYCGQPPVASRYLQDIEGKHRRCTNGDDELVPADGRWYRYECPAQHWWISAPAFKKAPTTT